MYQLSLIFFWFISAPIAVFNNHSESFSDGVRAVIYGFLFFFGGILGWLVLVPASASFTVIVMILIGIVGVTITSITISGYESATGWCILLFFSGTVWSQIIRLLVSIY